MIQLKSNIVIDDMLEEIIRKHIVENNSKVQNIEVISHSKSMSLQLVNAVVNKYNIKFT